MRQHGFTTVELMVTVGIAVILLGLGLMSFSTMMASSQTKSMAESMLSGLRLARSEAIKRNAPMRFQMVSTLDDGCTYSSTAQLWAVTQYVSGPPEQGLVAGGCASHPYTPPDQPDICDPDVPACTGAITSNCRGVAAASNTNPTTCTEDPLVAYKSDNRTVQTVAIDATDDDGASASVVTFSPLGRVLANAEGSPSLSGIDVSSTNAEAKAWRVQINAGSGSIKLCDPDAAANTPQACS